MKVLEQAEENFLAHMDDKFTPACFENNKKWESWIAMEKDANTKPRALPCRDCTLEYHNRMVLEGRCAQAGVPDIAKIFGRD